jgi:hypothetical protein
MQIGAVAVPVSLSENVLGEQEATFKATFRIEGGQTVTPWVRKNQGALLSECMLTTQEVHEQRIARFREWLADLPAALGFAEKVEIIPYGWCTGSDVAYLLDLLGPFHDLVSYRSYDLKSLMSAAWGKLEVSEGEAQRRLTVDPNRNRHDALSDAKYQLELLRALMEDAYHTH